MSLVGDFSTNLILFESSHRLSELFGLGREESITSVFQFER